MTAPGFALSSHLNLREGTDSQRRRQARARAEVRTASRRGRRERMALRSSEGRDSRTSAAAPGNGRRGLCRGGAASIFDDSDSRPLLSAPKNKKGFSSELIRSEGMPPHRKEQGKPEKRTSMDGWIRRLHGRRTDAGGDGGQAQPSSSLLLCWNRSLPM